MPLTHNSTVTPLDAIAKVDSTLAIFGEEAKERSCFSLEGSSPQIGA